jgi:hypothetical protein
MAGWRFGTRFATTMGVLTITLSAGVADASPNDREQCATSAEEAQQLRDDGKYRAAREKLTTCARNVCPATIRNDCLKWLSDLDRDAPTVVFGARDKDGNDVFDVKVSMDGVPIQEHLDGKPVLVDSGEHLVKFEGAGVTKEQRILIRAGERTRPITVTLGTTPSAPPQTEPQASTSSKRSSLAVPLVIGGAGVVALGTFAVLAISGTNDVDHMRHTCRPTCAQSDVDSARHKILIGDVFLGVGVVAVGVATYMLLTRSSEDHPPATAGVHFDVSPTASGGYAGLRGSF